jgi:hypothetical protein
VNVHGDWLFLINLRLEVNARDGYLWIFVVSDLCLWIFVVSDLCLWIFWEIGGFWSILD